MPRLDLSPLSCRSSQLIIFDETKIQITPGFKKKIPTTCDTNFKLSHRLTINCYSSSNEYFKNFYLIVERPRKLAVKTYSF